MEWLLVPYLVIGIAVGAWAFREMLELDGDAIEEALTNSNKQEVKDAGLVLKVFILLIIVLWPIVILIWISMITRPRHRTPLPERTSLN